MAYLLTFESNEADVFQVLWEAVKVAKKGEAEIRPQAKVLRKLMRISNPVEDVLELACVCGRKTALPPALQVANLRKLKPEGGYIEMESAERKLIQGRLDEFHPADRFVLALDEAMGKLADARDYADSAALQQAITAWEQNRSAA